MSDTQQPIHVVISNTYSDDILDDIRAISPQLHVEQYDRNIPDDAWQKAEILYSIGGVLPEPGQAPNLRWIQLNSAGANHVLSRPIGQSSDLIITTASGIHARHMANYTLMMMMAFNFRLPELMDDQQHKRWRDDRYTYYTPQDMHRQTLGIAGYGTIGRELARVADALGMKVLATKRDATTSAESGRDYTPEGTGDPGGEIPERIYPSKALTAMAQECDYLVIITPLTEATRHMVNADVFEAMKETAFLVNIARGAVVDETAMIDALRDGKIAGAALDVFEAEPLPKDSPLWTMENVILTPHISGNTATYREQTAELFIANIKRYLDNKRLYNELNRETGY